jgi:hypothetical protein
MHPHSHSPAATPAEPSQREADRGNPNKPAPRARWLRHIARAVCGVPLWTALSPWPAHGFSPSAVMKDAE